MARKKPRTAHQPPKSASPSLNLPQSIEAAYILLIAQITLIYSKAIYYLFKLYLVGPQVEITLEKGILVGVVLLVPLILFVNILSGLLSTRKVIDDFNEYPNSLFALEMLMIVFMFILNNVVAFSFIPDSDKNYIEDFLSSGSGVGEEALNQTIQNIVQTLPPFLYFGGAAICFLYLLWNQKYAEEKNRIVGKSEENINMSSHNSYLTFAIISQFILFVSTLYFENVVVEACILSFWVFIWVYLNSKWIIDEPL